MKKYLFLTFDSPIDSKEVAVSGEIKNPFSIAISLVKRGHDVMIVTNKPKSKNLIGTEHIQGVKVVYFRDLPTFGIIRYLLRALAFSLVVHLSLDRKGRVLVSHSCYASLFIKGVKFITPHGTNIPEYRAESEEHELNLLARLKRLNSIIQGYLDSISMKKSDNVLSVSKFQMDEMEVIYGISRDRMSLAYNIPMCYSMNLVPRSTELLYDYLFVGRLAEKKGLKYIVELAQLYKDSKFVVVGGTEFFITINDTLYSRLSEISNITLVMDVPEEVLVEYYASSKILLVTSVGYESLPTVILEALNYGCIPVAPRAWGNVEVLSDEFLYDEGNMESLTYRIGQILSSDEFIKYRVKQQFLQIEQLFKNTLDQYE